jgi:hypothetical protein
MSTHTFFHLLFSNQNPSLRTNIRELTKGKVLCTNGDHFFFLFLFLVLGFEHRALCLLDRDCLPLEPHPDSPPTTLTFSCFSYFSNGFALFCSGQPGLQSSYLCLMSSWDYKHEPLCLALLTTFTYIISFDDIKCLR